MNFNSLTEVYSNYQKAVSDFVSRADKYESAYKKIDNDYNIRLSELNKEKESALILLKTAFEQQKDGFELERTKLSAEIRRYHYFFENGTIGKLTPAISNNIQNLNRSVNEFINIKIDTITKQHQEKIKNEENRFHKLFFDLQTNFGIERERCSSAAINFFENALTDFNNLFQESVSTQDIEQLSNRITAISCKDYSSLIEIGTFEIQRKISGLLLKKTVKVILPFLDTKSLLIIHNDNTATEAKDIVDNILTRTLLSIEVGKVKLTLSDLKGTCELFREFIPLDTDIVSLATGRAKLEQKLAEYDDTIQKISSRYTVSTRGNNFSSLGQYNYNLISQNKGEEVIPHNICVVLNLSFEIDEALNKKLYRLISNGALNGTQFVLMYNTDDQNKNSSEILNHLATNRDLATVDLVGDRSNFSNIHQKLIPNKVAVDKKHDLVESYNHQFKEISANIYKEHFINALPSKDYWFRNDPSKQVRIPVGKSKQHRGEQTIELKTADVQAHVLLSGGTGSGKTNFLKTFITSAALNYSPEFFELYLIDLKNGTGFDIFRKYKLPHVKLFAMGVENELILNLLEALNDEMNARFNLFTQFGVEDIAKFNDLVGSSDKVKRTILIVDEFASVFEEGNPYQEEIVARISPLAKKGRAAGINLFFSTQNFGAIRGGFTNLMSEIPVRIVLKSDLKASHALLDSKNDAMKFVRTIGDGVVNYKFGNKLDEKDNEIFKGYLLENTDLEKILADISREVKSKNLKSNDQLVYDSDKPATIENNNDVMSIKRFTISTNEIGEDIYEPVQHKSTTLWLGEPTIISTDHFKISLKREYEENILLSGREKNVSINILYNILSSLAHQYSSGEIAIRIFSFLSEDENLDLKLSDLEQLGTEYDFKLLTDVNYKNELALLNSECDIRQRNNNTQGKRIFAFFLGLENARDIYRESYDYSSEGQLFMNLLKNGSKRNIHSVVEVRQPSDLFKIMLNQDISVFRHRIVFHLGSIDESSIVIGNGIASSLFKKEKPNSRYLAIYHDTNDERIRYKFKPYIDLISNPLFMPADFGKYIIKTDVFAPSASVNVITDVKNAGETTVGKENGVTNEQNISPSETGKDLLGIRSLKEEALSLEEDDDNEAMSLDEFLNSN